MFPLKKSSKKKQIRTQVKARTPEELEMRVKTLTDKGWTVLKSDTYERNDSVSFNVYRRGNRGMGKTSSLTVIQGSVLGYWCELLSPMP